MIFLKAILLGAVQGISEFFPVSSSGHISLIGNFMGVGTDVFFMAMLHVGTLAAVVLYFRREIMLCLAAYAGMGADILYNLRHMFVHSPYEPEAHGYRKLLSDNYRKMSAMLLIAMLPIIIVGAILAPAAELLSTNTLCAGMGFFITALILLVASFSNWGRKAPREAKLTDALMVGAFQSMAVFPGISRFAMTYSAGLYRGFSKKFAKLFSFMLLIPSVIGAMVLEGVRSPITGAPSVGIAPAICGMLTSLVVGYFVIRIAMRITSKAPLKAFSIYCFIIGAVSVFVYLA